MVGVILIPTDIIVLMDITHGTMIGAIMDTDMVMATIIPITGGTIIIRLIGMGIEVGIIHQEILKKGILLKDPAHLGIPHGLELQVVRREQQVIQ